MNKCCLDILKFFVFIFNFAAFVSKTLILSMNAFKIQRLPRVRFKFFLTFLSVKLWGPVFPRDLCPRQVYRCLWFQNLHQSVAGKSYGSMVHPGAGKYEISGDRPSRRLGSNPFLLDLHRGVRVPHAVHVPRMLRRVLSE